MNKLALAALLTTATALTACGGGNTNFGQAYVGTWQSACVNNTMVMTRYDAYDETGLWITESKYSYPLPNCGGQPTLVSTQSNVSDYSGASFVLTDGTQADGVLEFGLGNWLNLKKGQLCKGDLTYGRNPDGYPAQLQQYPNCAVRVG